MRVRMNVTIEKASGTIWYKDSEYDLDDATAVALVGNGQADPLTNIVTATSAATLATGEAISMNPT